MELIATISVDSNIIINSSNDNTATTPNSTTFTLSVLASPLQLPELWPTGTETQNALINVHIGSGQGREHLLPFLAALPWPHFIVFDAGNL